MDARSRHTRFLGDGEILNVSVVSCVYLGCATGEKGAVAVTDLAELRAWLAAAPCANCGHTTDRGAHSPCRGLDDVSAISVPLRWFKHALGVYDAAPALLAEIERLQSEVRSLRSERDAVLTGVERLDAAQASGGR